MAGLSVAGYEASLSANLLDLLTKHQLTPEQLSIPCSDEHLEKVARKLTSWKVLAPGLGLSEDEVTAIQRDHQDDCLASLIKWRDKLKKKATYLKLATGLDKIGCLDLVKEVMFVPHARAKEIVHILVKTLEV